MAPEQLKRDGVDRRADVYAVGVMLWECLAGKKLFVADDALAVMHAVLTEPVQPISELASVSDELAAIVHRALDRDPARRFESAAVMAEALEAVAPPAPQRELAAWVREMAAETLDALEAKLADIESQPSEVSALSAPPQASASIVALTEQPTSMVSGISVVNDTPVRRRTKWPAIAVIGAASAGIVGVVVWRIVVAAHPTVQQVTTHASETPPPPSVTQPTDTTTAAPPPTTTGTTSTTTAPKPPPTHTHVVVVTPPPRSSAKPSANCTPPVYVDSAGIEHVKPECLK